MMTYEAASLAKSAGARELWLTHYSPQMTDPDEYTEQVCSVFPNTIIPHDSLSCVLHFEN